MLVKLLLISLIFFVVAQSQSMIAWFLFGLPLTYLIWRLDFTGGANE